MQNENYNSLNLFENLASSLNEIILLTNLYKNLNLEFI